MDYDIVIIGGGPAGLSFACSMAGLNLNVLLVEKSSLESISKPNTDGREIALTHHSRKILINIHVRVYSRYSRKLNIHAYIPVN